MFCNFKEGLPQDALQRASEKRWRGADKPENDLRDTVCVIC